MLETKIKAMNVIPSVQEEIRLALQDAEITTEAQLDILLPALKKSLEITKSDEDGTYKVVLTANGKVLRHEPIGDDDDDGSLFTIADYISDFVFEPGENVSSKVRGIPYEKSMNLSGDDLLEIAAGTAAVLPPKKDKPIPNSIASSDGKGLSKNLEEIASGKRGVDMSK